MPKVTLNVNTVGPKMLKVTVNTVGPTMLKVTVACNY